MALNDLNIKASTNWSELRSSMDWRSIPLCSRATISSLVWHQKVSTVRSRFVTSYLLEELQGYCKRTDRLGNSRIAVLKVQAESGLLLSKADLIRSDGDFLCRKYIRPVLERLNYHWTCHIGWSKAKSMYIVRLLTYDLYFGGAGLLCRIKNTWRTRALVFQSNGQHQRQQITLVLPLLLTSGPLAFSWRR